MLLSNRNAFEVPWALAVVSPRRHHCRRNRCRCVCERPTPSARVMSPESSGSGSLTRAPDSCALHGPRVHDPRNDHESSAPKSMSVRSSSGSRPRNHDVSMPAPARDNADCQHAGSDVNRVEMMVPERRLWILGGRRTVHERRRSERRRADSRRRWSSASTVRPDSRRQTLSVVNRS